MNKSEDGKSSIMSPIDVKYLALAYPPAAEQPADPPAEDTLGAALEPDAEITVTIRRYGETYYIVDREKLAEFFK